MSIKSNLEKAIEIISTLNESELERLKVILDISLQLNSEGASGNKEEEFVPLELDNNPEYYRKLFGFVPSEYQQNIINWVASGSGNGCCNAVAGSGKSTTLYLIAKILQEQGYSPYDVKVCVFGKANSKDLIEKFGESWKTSISTLHSAGWNLLKEELQIKNTRNLISSRKYFNIARDRGLIGKKRGERGILRNDRIVEQDMVFFKLLDLIRLCDLENNVENLEKLVEHYNLEGVINYKLLVNWIGRVLEIGNNQSLRVEKFDFVDQLYLPVKMKICDRSWFKPYKFLLVDECQDLNSIQLQLVQGLAGNTGRILSVGDPKQSILGFAGASSDSYEQVKAATKAQELPLSICYRCPTSHIELVNTVYPEIPIKAVENAIPGEIVQVEEHEVVDTTIDGDLILSRRTAPLVGLCLKLIANKKNAQIKGRAIGDSLKQEMEEITKFPGYSWEDFEVSCQRYLKEKCKRYEGKDNEEQLIENLSDKIGAIKQLHTNCLDAKDMNGLAEEVDKIFSDENSAITLSTCHRAKGLEADRVTIYQPSDLPFHFKKMLPWQVEQEKNVHYVALTRAKKTLTIVGNCDWYKSN